MDSPVPETSSTLLRDLVGGADSARWTDFVDLYTPVLIYWLNGLRKGALPSLSPAMYDDIVQETLVSLMKLFPKRRFNRDRARFRTFLSTILRHRAIDFLRMSGYAILTFMPDDELRDMREADAIAGKTPCEEQEGERRELRAQLWRMLIDRVFRESRFSGQSKAIFLRSVAGEPIDALAKEFGVNRNTIYQMRHRVMGKLEEKARALSRESDDILDMIAALESDGEGSDGNGR